MAKLPWCRNFRNGKVSVDPNKNIYDIGETVMITAEVVSEDPFSAIRRFGPEGSNLALKMIRIPISEPTSQISKNAYWLTTHSTVMPMTRAVMVMMELSWLMS